MELSWGLFGFEGKGKGRQKDAFLQDMRVGGFRWGHGAA